LITVEVGDELPGRTVQHVSADHIAIMALVLQDSNPIHWDVAAVEAAGMGDREVNQGGSTMAYVTGMLADWAGSRSAVRRISCRFTANVFAGDDVVAGGTVTAVERVDGGRLVTCDVWADRADGVRAIGGTAEVLLVAEPDQ
jgi:acyl dehydratase